MATQPKVKTLSALDRKKFVDPNEAKGSIGQRFLSFFTDVQDDIFANDTTPHFFDAEEETKQERISRLLHTAKNKQEFPKDGPLFDFFIVVGLPLSQKRGREFENISDPLAPAVLFQYTVDDQKSLPPLQDICFPKGISKDLTKSLPEPKFMQPENSYIFLITSEDASVAYGVCVYKDEIVEQGPFGYTISSLCYCIITRVPFFRLHQEFLTTLLVMEDIEYIASLPPDYIAVPENELKKQNGKIELGLKNANSALLSLKSYSELPIPEPQQKLRFENLEFVRPLFDDDEQMIVDWGLGLTVHMLNFKILFGIISAVLLEKKVVFVSPNLRILSSVMLSFLPLLKPFVYQSIVITCLPSKMFSVLEAPVPFMVGLTDVPPKDSSLKELVIVDLTKGTIKSSDNIPNLAGYSSLKKKYLPLQKQFVKTLRKEICKRLTKNSTKKKKGEVPYNPNPHQHEIIDEIWNCFRQTFESTLSGFRKHCISDLTDQSGSVTVFMRDSFCSTLPKGDLPFFKQFLDTQTFSDFVDKKLRQVDDKKNVHQTI